jgi:hypothetical protein
MGCFWYTTVNTLRKYDDDDDYDDDNIRSLCLKIIRKMMLHILFGNFYLQGGSNMTGTVCV